MKANNIKTGIYAAVMLLLMISCKDELTDREPVSSDSTEPKQVSEVQVTNRPGNVKLTYKTPADVNLLYVKAEYTITSGKVMEAKASYYSDSLVLEGFADTLEHEVKLYTVSRSEVKSQPMTVKIKPLTAPIWPVYESIEIINAFGGYKLTAVNETKAPIAILILKRNAVNEWEVDNDLSIYTSGNIINSQKSGMDTVSRQYGIAVRDRWGNLTDTLFQQVDPIYEVELNTANFKAFTLPGDPVQQPGAAIENMWNKTYGWPVSFTSLATATLKTPSIVTIDMGTTAKLSKVWIRPFKELSNLYYGFTTLKRFELWGSTNPNLDGSLDASWTLLGNYELTKPSGSAGATETASDQEAAANGFYYDIDLSAPKIRYMRIRCLENWAGSCPQSVDELKIFGDPR
ncbi:MAG TPA: DUF4959 domain-containing protein [Cyclobacteriaceae bacterium]|jgi:hypothetical protein|nr:DUF4959 domain-containing protein [Cyclobacteriaceae bacterium]